MISCCSSVSCFSEDLITNKKEDFRLEIEYKTNLMMQKNSTFVEFELIDEDQENLLIYNQMLDAYKLVGMEY